MQVRIFTRAFCLSSVLFHGLAPTAVLTVHIQSGLFSYVSQSASLSLRRLFFTQREGSPQSPTAGVPAYCRGPFRATLPARQPFTGSLCPEKSTRHSSAWPSGFLRDGPQLTFLASCFPVPHTYSAHTRTHTRDPQIESFSTYLNFSKLQSSHVRASAVRSASVRYLR